MSNLLIIFILGTIVGSFLNVLIHRLPRGESIIFPASHCPQCNQRLSIIDLIPILGYFILRGKCRCCKASISFRYPLVELLTGLLFMAVVLVSSSPGEIVAYLLFCSLLIVVFFTDLEQQIIHDHISLTGIVVGLIFNFIRGLNFFYSAIIGASLGFTLLFLVAKFGKFIFKKEAMGEGDWYLAAMLGAFLGWPGVLLAIFLAYLVAAMVAVVFLALGKVKMGQQVAFGPALAVGALLTLFFGSKIIDWYLSRFHYL